MSAPERRGRGRGGQGGYEPRHRIRLRELQAVELALQGWSQRAIAEELHLSQPGVSKILKRAYTRMAAELGAEVEEQHARLIRQLRHVQTESARTWVVSQQPAVRRRQRKVLAPGQPERTEVELVEHERHGDVRCLDLMRRATCDELRLYERGMGSRGEPAPVSGPAELSDAELVVKLRECLQVIETSLGLEASLPDRPTPVAARGPTASAAPGDPASDLQERMAAYRQVLEERRRRGGGARSDWHA